MSGTGAVPGTAMIMAAGLGTRMRPLTNSTPKPLICVDGKPLLGHILDHLKSAGVERVVVNVHYLADQVEDYLAANAEELDIAVSDERGLLLETGGGLVKAQPMIDSDPFLALNSDNLWVDGPSDTLRSLSAQWDSGKMDALLLLVPRSRAFNYKGAGDFQLGVGGRITRRTAGEEAPYVFTGIQIIAKRLLRDAPEGPFSTNVLWTRAISEGRCFGAVHQGLWFDVGTPQAIKQTEAALTRV